MSQLSSTAALPAQARPALAIHAAPAAARPPQGWSDARVAALGRLWRDGLSASQIARALGGVTRNAVIGKAHRLGLAGTRPAVRRAPRPARPPRAPAARPPRTVAASPCGRPAAAPEELRGQVARMEDLCARACRWPIGDPRAGDFAFCGRDAEEGPYCLPHRRRAFRPGAMRPAEVRALRRLLLQAA